MSVDDGARALADARAHILATIVDHPRSRQVRIGPSELGTECDHCLAAKLAGWVQNEGIAPDVVADESWFTVVGTAVHAYLERAFSDVNVIMDGTADPWRYMTEVPVCVGEVGGERITGSVDLVDLGARTLIDWKIVGRSTLSRVRKSGPSPVYQIQTHLYGKGLNDADVDIEWVALYFLPRESGHLLDGWSWHVRYDPLVAARALDRANQISDNIRLAYSNTNSLDAVDDYIRGLPRGRACFDCKRYSDFEEYRTGRRKA